MDDYKYEVAFSFLAQDEPLALQLETLLSDRLTTFIYSKRQGEIAGTDGEETFGKVFGLEARVVVVLFREGWGLTPWTRIEQTAIRNRAYGEGYDFVLFIPLDKSALPPWLPKTHVWIGMDRWGISQAAGVIEMRVTEKGGSVREESALQQAERLYTQTELERTRESFLESDAGVKAAKAQLSVLFELFEKESAAIAQRAPIFQPTATRLTDKMNLACAGVRLTIAWSLQYSNSLKYSSLNIMMWKGEREIYNEETRMAEAKYRFDRLANGTLGWRQDDREARFFQTEALVDHHLKQMLNSIPGLNDYLHRAGK